jgi:exo-beta-1,3-glucanase (GH17 family)
MRLRFSHSLGFVLLVMFNGVAGQGVTESPTSPMLQLVRKIEEGRWVSFTPTHYDPTRQPPLQPSADDMRRDLETLRPYFDCLITYGLGGVLNQVPQIAKNLQYRGIIIGIWDPFSKTEIQRACDLAKAGLIDAICVGNEGLGSRYQWSQLEPIMRDLRTSTGLPVTTTEQIEDYGDPRLLATDFLLPNIHPLWHNQTTSATAANWVDGRVRALEKAAPGKPLLVKESGFPSAGPAYCTEQMQADFYSLLAERAKVTPSFYFAYFESFDQFWKNEQFSGSNVGPHWGLFRSDRSPKLVVSRLSKFSTGVRKFGAWAHSDSPSLQIPFGLHAPLLSAESWSRSFGFCNSRGERLVLGEHEQPGRLCYHGEGGG